MKKQLPKPENWQDFESLCKKLWGVIWEVPIKIKKNGRNGQTQFGVDVYAVPKNHHHYWGIQCKGKDEYTKSKLSKKEIDEEIKKAKNFTPELEVFIFATTSNKDREIEEYIRVKDLENRKCNGFEILLFCWEDIVDLIEENRDVYNWYMHSNKFKSSHDFDVFINVLGRKKALLRPEFYQTTTNYRLNNHNSNPRFNRGSSNILDLTGGFGSYSRKKKSLSYCSVKLLLVNTGNMVIENWKTHFQINGELTFLGNYNKGSEENKYGTNIISPGTNKSYEDLRFSKSSPLPLIQKDFVAIELWLLPLPKEYEITLNWEILARDFSKEGDLVIKIKPDIQPRILTHEVEFRNEIRASETKIEEKIK